MFDASTVYDVDLKLYEPQTPLSKLQYTIGKLKYLLGSVVLGANFLTIKIFVAALQEDYKLCICLATALRRVLELLGLC